MPLKQSRIIFKALAVTLSLSVVQSAFAQPQCSEIFQLSSASDMQTALDKHIAGLTKLSLLSDIAVKNGTNTLGLEGLKARYRLKEKELLEFVKTNNLMSRRELGEKIDLDLAQQRQLTGLDIDGAVAIFHRVEPKDLSSNNLPRVDSDRQRLRSQRGVVEKPFELMATPVTQVIWRRISKISNRLINAPHLPNSPSHFSGETHPVETVRKSEVNNWIDYLNMLSLRGEPELTKIIAGHKDGDRYRLPTDAEMELMIAELRKSSDPQNTSALHDHGWFAKNSGQTTHAVAQRAPLVIGGKEFYDIMGNVWEWTTNPNQADSRYQPVRGGSWGDSDRLFQRDDRAEVSVKHSALNNVGFRLVREVRP